MKELKLSKGKVCLIDDDDFEIFGKHKWSYATVGYATMCIIENGIHKNKYLHRLIMNPDSNKFVDHINGNKLDNRKCNLRVCTKMQNAHNQKKKAGSSRFKGVAWWERDKKWKASITKNYKAKSIGYYSSQEQAAEAYDIMALKLFGEFAKPNLACSRILFQSQLFVENMMHP